jgi:dolichol-phosphate mannosyltransferase
MHDIRSADDWPAGRVLVQAATFNERENVAGLIEAILAVMPDAQVLIIDDDSPDGTGRLALEIAARNKRVHVLVRRGRRGLGSAILEGFRLARCRGFDVAVNMDADFSHDPADIPRLVATLDQPGDQPVDLVIGSRRVPGGKIVGWPVHRQVISRLVSWFTRWVLRVPVRDATSGFRTIRTAILDRLDDDLPAGYAFFEHMLVEVQRAGGRITEIPITFTERRAGVSKVGVAESLRSGCQLLQLARALWLGKQGSGRR